MLAHNVDSLKARFPNENPDLTEFLSVLFHLEHLPASDQTDMTSVSERSREKEVAKRRLATLMTGSSDIRKHVEANIEEFNGQPGRPDSFDLLHNLLELQPYRLSSWRTATHEINYRRFFDVNELAAIRMEDSGSLQRYARADSAAHSGRYQLRVCGWITSMDCSIHAPTLNICTTRRGRTVNSM